MRFTVFSMTIAMAVAAFAPQVSATPVFARQTGMACSSCHFQHFPLLNGFGRSYKSAGFTMMGGQVKLEGEGLSIPNTLNMAVVTTTGYEKSNQATAATLALTTPEKTTGDGVLYVPGGGGELSLFFGGRLGENAGFLGELNTGNAAGAHSSAKMPINVSHTLSFMPEGMRVSVIPFATDALGASYGFELLNTGANAAHQMSGTPGFNGAHSGAISAQQYIGTNGPAKGFAFVVTHPMGFINLTKFDRTGIAGGALASMGSTYIRVAGIFELAGWDTAVGAQAWSGSSAARDTLGLLVSSETKASAIDGQMQGYLGDMPVGFYVSYATAPAVASDPAAKFAGNAYNTYWDANVIPAAAEVTGTSTKTSLNISGEVGVVPEKATLGAAIRSGKSGDGKTDNAIMLTGTYKLAQNMLASLTFTSASGSYWLSNATGTGTTDAIGNTTYTINLFTAF